MAARATAAGSGGDPQPTPAALFAALDARLRADPRSTHGLKAVYAFALTGTGGGSFHVTLDDGTGSAGEGAVAEPDTTLAMSAEDFVPMTSGRLDGTLAYIDGRITITGDIQRAIDLGRVFAPEEPGIGTD